MGLRHREVEPNAENATLEEMRVAMEASPNRRSYIRRAVMRSLLMGLERGIVAQQFCRSDRVVRLWIALFNLGRIDTLRTKRPAGRGRRVKLERWRDLLVPVLENPGQAGEVHHWTGAVVHRGLRERDRETRVVKLAIEILYSSEEVFRLDIRDSGKRFLAREHFRRGEVQAAGQGVVDLQPDSEKWSLPPFVARNNKGEVIDKVGRVPMEQAPFPQGFQDQRNIALLKVTNAAVNQFCAAA